jgi:hypothetical protein
MVSKKRRDRYGVFKDDHPEPKDEKIIHEGVIP